LVRAQTSRRGFVGEQESKLNDPTTVQVDLDEIEKIRT
jgi:hypothetical protein